MTCTGPGCWGVSDADSEATEVDEEQAIKAEKKAVGLMCDAAREEDMPQPRERARACSEENCAHI